MCALHRPSDVVFGFILALSSATGCDAPPAESMMPPIEDQTTQESLLAMMIESKLGTVTELATPCRSGAPALPGTVCKQLEIACPAVGAEKQIVNVRVTEPPAGVTNRGTITFHSGGAGGGFYGGTTPTDMLMQDLNNQGFTIVDRGWEGVSGWLTGPGGAFAVACRSGTLMRYIKQSYHHAGGLCATGNSGGSVELSYIMGRWNGGSRLDYVLETSGPLDNLDYACHGNGATWDAQCMSLYGAHFSCGATYACTLASQVAGLVDSAYRTTAEIMSSTGPALCSGSVTAEQHAQLAADSPTAPGAITNFKKTRMDFVYGQRDCTIGVPPGGVSFANTVFAAGTTGDITYLSGVGHGVPNDPLGVSTMTAKLLEQCVNRH